jgi:4-carboxymuconolactone decarboxylase
VTDEHYERGVEAMDELQGERAGPRIRAALRGISPEFERYAVSASYGDVYTRGVLELRDRQLITIAALAAIGGCEPQLERHLLAGIKFGLTPDEIVELCIQIGAYAGQPRANNAMRVAGKVFEKLGVSATGVELGEEESGRSS